MSSNTHLRNFCFICNEKSKYIEDKRKQYPNFSYPNYNQFNHSSNECIYKDDKRFCEYCCYSRHTIDQCNLIYGKKICNFCQKRNHTIYECYYFQRRKKHTCIYCININKINEEFVASGKASEYFLKNIQPKFHRSTNHPTEDCTIDMDSCIMCGFFHISYHGYIYNFCPHLEANNHYEIYIENKPKSKKKQLSTTK